jgi:hypothetical protein
MCVMEDVMSQNRTNWSDPKLALAVGEPFVGATWVAATLDAAPAPW